MNGHPRAAALLDESDAHRGRAPRIEHAITQMEQRTPHGAEPGPGHDFLIDRHLDAIVFARPEGINAENAIQVRLRNLNLRFCTSIPKRLKKLKDRARGMPDRVSSQIRKISSQFDVKN